MNIKISENIKRIRKAKKITQEGLAEIFNVTPAAVSKWENNETYPDITLLFPLSHLFGVSIDELMGYDYILIEEEIKKVYYKFSLYYKRCIKLKCKYIIREL